MPVLKFWNPRTRRHEPVNGPVGMVSAQPGVTVLRNAAQTYAHAISQKVSFDTVSRDTDGFYAAATPTRVTARVAGWYAVTFTAEVDVNGTTASAWLAQAWFEKNAGGAGSVPKAGFHQTFAAGRYFTLRGSSPVYLAVGDYIEVTLILHSGINGMGVVASIDMTAMVAGTPGPRGPASEPSEAPGVKVRFVSAAPYLLGAGAWAQLPLNTEDRDTHGYYPGSGNTVTIPVGQGGWYHYIVSTFISGMSSGQRLLLSMGINGSFALASGIGSGIASAGGEAAAIATGHVYLSPGTVVDVRAYQDSAGSRSVGHVTDPYLQITLQLMKVEQVKGERGPAGGTPPPPIRRVITAVGTWTKPAGLSHIEVEVQGGGGGGGGSSVPTATAAGTGAGGGGGGYAKKMFTAAELPASCAVTIGAGGAGGWGGAAGSAGGASSFAGTGITTVSGGGGGGGAGGGTAGGWAYVPGGPAGSGSGGDVNLYGSDGSTAWTIQMPNSYSPGTVGHGGASFLGGGSRSLSGDNPAGHAYGGGGAGSHMWAQVLNNSGGTGGVGVVIVTEYYV